MDLGPENGFAHSSNNILVLPFWYLPTFKRRAVKIRLRQVVMNLAVWNWGIDIQYARIYTITINMSCFDT